MSVSSALPEHSRHRTEPDHETRGWPKGVAYIIGNEGCERFSFYGMKAILYVYLTHLLTMGGVAEGLAERHATGVVHTFIAGVYALPMIGAIIADRLLGKYQTIIWLSLVYCAGHACLAVFEGNFTGFAFGLGLIALGSGGIKPCVSAHVGDQFGRNNWFRLPYVYGAFYFIINFGSMFSNLLIPWVKEAFGWSIAFAIPGILMGVATVFFWMGRNTFVHVPPRPGGKLGLMDVAVGLLLFTAVGLPMFGSEVVAPFGRLALIFKVAVCLSLLAGGAVVFAWRQRLSPDDGFLAVLYYAVRVRLGAKELKPLPEAAETAPDKGELAAHPFWASAVRRFGVDSAGAPLAVLRICSVFAMVSVFWALFDQYASSWVEQARSMDRHFSVFSFEFTILPSQVSAVNPMMVMVLVPAMAKWGYPMMERVFRLKMTPLVRMTIGMFVASLSFVVVALLQQRLDAGENVHVSWQILAFLVITLAEVMVSVTGLEFAYTQAPRRMKSLIMGFWLFTVALGNVLVVFLAGFQGLPWVTFFWIFAVLMAVAAALFGLRARFYEYRSYTQ